MAKLFTIHKAHTNSINEKHSLKDGWSDMLSIIDAFAFRLSVFRQSFKLYSALIPSVILTIIAILLFIPTLILGNNLKERMNESVAMAEQVRSLLPTVVSRGELENLRNYYDAMEREAERIAELSKQTTQRELLSYSIFPEPADSSMFIFHGFGEKFREGIENTLQKLNAKDCPSKAEVASAVGSPYKISRSRNRRLDDSQKSMLDAICLNHASSTSVYINPSDISGYEFWEDYEYVRQDKAVEECWYWQLGYWAIEDVLTTIHNMNQGEDSVLTAPVKRLVNISFSPDNNRNNRFSNLSRPQYVLTDQDGLITSLTGRKCDEEIDVIHFKMEAVVNAKQILPFMKELCSGKPHKFKGFSGRDKEQTFTHNQITILSSSIEPIIREDPEHELYRYGNAAVAKLSLTCEYIFNKEAYDTIKPELLKSTV